MRLAIVEDDSQDLKALKECLEEYSQKEKIRFSITAFTDSESFLESKSSFDIVFFDIELPGRNGLSAAHALREINPSTTIIFITNRNQYAIKGYEVRAFDFIVKPVHYYDFSIKLKRAINHVMAHEEAKATIRTNRKVVVVSVSDISYIEVCNHKVVYHTSEGDYDTYNETLRDIALRLSENGFALCNSYLLVNRKYVTGISSVSVFLGDKVLPISHGKRKSFARALTDYFGESI